MLDITLFVLVLQVGLNSAFYIRGHYRNPSSHSLYSRYTEQTRRDADADLYQPNHSYESDSDYSSYEDDNLKVLPVRSYKRRKDYLRFPSPDYESTLEAAPLSKPRSNTYVERSIPLPVVRRSYRDRASYLRHRAPNLIQPHRRNSISNIKDFLSSYANSLEVIDQSDDDDNDNLLYSLVSLLSQLGHDDRTRKYNRKNDNLSLEEVSDETMDSEEEIDSRLETSRFNNQRSYYLGVEPSYKRHDYRKRYNNNRHDLQIQRTQSAEDTSDETDAIVISDDGKLYDAITIARPKTKKSDLISNRSDNQDSDIVDAYKNRKKVKDYRIKSLSFNGDLKPFFSKSKNFTKCKKIVTDIGADLLLNDNADQFTKLPLLSILNSLPSIERKLDSRQNENDNKQPKTNFLTLDGEVASNLTDLLSENKLNVITLVLDDNQMSNKKPKLRTVLETLHNNNNQLENYDTAGAETHGFSRNVYLRSYDDISLVKRLLADELKDHNNQNKEVDSIEEISLDTNNVKDEESSGLYSLNIELPILETHSGLRTNLDTEELTKKIVSILQLALSSSEQHFIENDNIDNKTVSEDNVISSISSEKQNNETVDTADDCSHDDAHNTDFKSLRTIKPVYDTVNTTDKFHLEYPWNGQLSPDDENKNNAPQTQKSENFTDVLHLEYPWNDELSLENRNLSNTLRTQKSQTDKKATDTLDSTNELYLEFPWNGELNPDKDNVNNTLRTQNLEDFTDVLHLEYPWNDELSPEKPNLNDALRTKKSHIDKEVTNSVDSTNILHLEFPWKDELSPDKNKVNNPLRTQKSQIDKQVKDAVHSSNVLHLEYPWNDQLSPNDDAVNNSLRSQNSEDSTDILHLEYPWNSQLSIDDRNETEALRTQKSNNSTDELHLEFPWNDQLSPDNETVENALRTQNSNDFTDVLHLEYPWNGQQSSDNEKVLLTSRKLNTQLRRREEKYNPREYTNAVDLEFPWNNQPRSDDNKNKMRSESKPDKGKDLKKYNIVIEYPWNGDVSQDEEKVGEKVVKHLDSKTKITHLQKHKKSSNHYSRSTYYDDSNDLKSKRDLSKAVKDLENKYNELKNIVLEFPWKAALESIEGNIVKKPVARTHSHDIGVPRNQPLRPEYHNYNRRAQYNVKRQHENYIPIPKADFDKIVSKHEKSDEVEDSSDFITYPLDRRPVARLAAHHKDVYTGRRSNSLSGSTDKLNYFLINTTNDIDNELNNDNYRDLI